MILWLQNVCKTESVGRMACEKEKINFVLWLLQNRMQLMSSFFLVTTSFFSSSCWNSIAFRYHGMKLCSFSTLSRGWRKLLIDSKVFSLPVLYSVNLKILSSHSLSILYLPLSKFLFKEENHLSQIVNCISRCRDVLVSRLTSTWMQNSLEQIGKVMRLLNSPQKTRVIS